MQRYLILILLVSLQIVVHGQVTPVPVPKPEAPALPTPTSLGLPRPTTVKSARYWFDDDAGSVQFSNIQNGSHTVDASTLLEGVHTIHYQIIDSENNVGPAYSGVFLKTRILVADRGTTLRYWFDDDSNVMTCNSNVGVQQIDVSSLIDGLHTIHYMAVCNDGSITPAQSSVFLKLSMSTETTVVKSVRYWFDNDTNAKTTSVAGGIQSIDVTNLLTGVHTIHYQLVDDKGNVSTPESGMFVKMCDKVVESSDNVITRYVYWTNENTAAHKSVEIDKPSSPYQLVTLLPMIKAPIRTSNFHFEVENGTPKIFAKNDLHIRFEDAAGYWVDDACSYVDYSVSETVTDIEELQPTQTFTRPDENKIKWFKFEAGEGDTIAIKASQSTTLQVFAPSGEEILSAMGDVSVHYSFAVVLEKGTYYVAVHDVTGSGQDVTLEYMHMKKSNDIILGDVNCDGKLTLDDITLTIDYYLGREVYILEVAADMDGNGQIDISDITEMIGQYLQAEARRRSRE